MCDESILSSIDNYGFAMNPPIENYTGFFLTFDLFLASNNKVVCDAHHMCHNSIKKIESNGYFYLSRTVSFVLFFDELPTAFYFTSFILCLEIKTYDN